MNMLMTNKKIVVMGVANKWSIAWGIAQHLRQHGAEIIYTYYGESSQRNLQKLLSAEGIDHPVLVSCNVSDDQDMARAFEEIGQRVGKIDGLAHCIAHAKKEELEGRYIDTSREGFLMAHDISAYSLVAAVKYAMPLLNPHSAFITLSYLGGERAVANYNVMGVAKAALDASVRYLAADIGKEGHRINGLSAGPIRTLAAKGVSGLSEIIEVYAEKSPLKRAVDQDDIGKTAVYMLSDLSSGVTGELIHVDCGYHIVGV